MLHALGVQMKIIRARDAGAYMMPDGHGALKAYNCQEIWRGLIASIDTQRLLALGLKTRRLNFTIRAPQRDARHFVSVVDVIDRGRVDDTYCFTEPKRHMGVFNGILAGNCSEITLDTAADRTAVCCLSSLNAERYDEWKGTTLVYDLIEMLDNVLQYFIDHAPDTLARARYSAMRERSLGLGVMGFHSYLQGRGVAFESEEAREINREMFHHIKFDAATASLALGAERGVAPDLIEGGGSPYRNTHLLAIAPNANSAILLDTAPSVEPNAANAYVHDTRAGTWAVKNRSLERLLERKGKNTEAVWQDIVLNQGSVQHLDFLSDHEKAVFKTAIELDQMWVVQHAADRQPFICQAQSINLFFPPRADRAYINRVHIAAWQKGLKSLYYSRSRAKNRADSVSVKIERVALKDAESLGEADCVACQG